MKNIFTSNAKRCFVLLVSVLITVSMSYSQTTIFTETMGTVAATTTIAAHESANGFDNDSYTMSGTGDLRNTTVSTGYASASGVANIFLTNTIGRYFLIEGINTLGYSNLKLSFGLHKSTTASNGSELVFEISTDGTTYTQIAITALPTGTGTAIWYYVSVSGTIPAAANLRIRFTQSSIVPQFRIDDILLQDTVPACVPTEYPHMTGAFINSCNGSCLEGNNEILFFNAGSCPFVANPATVQIYYQSASPPTINYTDSFATNASYVSDLNAAAAASGCASPLFIDASDGSTVIPAYATIFIMRSNPCYAYDFSAFCAVKPIYILFTSDASWIEGGNFANTDNNAGASELRYFRSVINGTTYDYSYVPDLLTSHGDGDCIAFDYPIGTGAASDYFNDGCTPPTPVLPIGLAYFSVSCSGDLVKLDWATMTEYNNAFFTIEAAAESGEFEAIASVPGAGNSNEMLGYSIDISSGAKYFRLKQTDFDGQFTYSDIESAECLRGRVQLYPTVSMQGTPVTIDGKADLIDVFDSMGKMIYPEISDNQIFGLLPGMYFVVINNSQRFLIIVR
ncbi:MAG: hypothetical protein A2W93_15620 [Bacteroidetes bacterium GWF2_43_63]|nr:MAG: hypothetical protein A2W94_05395 [Bacteroidetes bacterium GWE2_42_42]OFY53447.1 MAG: hypothetical protein A2W93_15620 [Bacteroidetes bacterium GWF2_43_63]HBG69377.1 hypothetical protein [Bacteroidales bacterium]HCB61995.1 hypothetical protein [Bacteroidales bacterium]HCY23168.1 hypothetical protein [Bacteroidales bacterium]